MDLGSFFRRFFYRNSDPKHDDIFEINDNVRDERKDFLEYDDDFRDFNEHMNTFHKMNEMFDSIFMPSFGITIGFPRIDGQSPFGQLPFEQLPSEQSPRSIMLKDNEEKPNDSSLCKRNPQKCPFQEEEKDYDKVLPFSYSKFSSFKTIRLPDGTVEEHRTVIDNDGNKRTTVRRTIGDTSHEIITKSDKQGVKEKEENFLNMDENDLTNFEQKWKKLRSGDPVEPQAITLPPSVPHWYILRKFLGLPPNDEIK